MLRPRLAVAILVLLFCASLLAQSNPVPYVNLPLVPAAVPPGGMGPVLIVNGTGFVAGSVVEWNGTALATTFISQGRLTAAVADSMVAAPGTASVTVLNPAPGGGASIPIPLTVVSPTTSPSFGTLHPIGVGIAPVDVIAADFNNDGKPDLAVVTECGNACPAQLVGSRSISILLGNGDGTFFKKSKLVNLSFATSAVAGDFNHDGNMDLVVISEPNCQGCAFVTTYLGRGDGTFKVGKLAMPGIDGNISGVAVGDFNRDGNLDLAVSAASKGLPWIFILLGNGNGTFNSANAIMFPDLAGGAVAVTAGDFNNDGILDLADIYPGDNGTQFQIFLGRGDGIFATTPHSPRMFMPMSLIWGPPVAMATGDFNGDGVLDLAYVDSAGSLDVWSGQGDGTFAQQSSQAAPAEAANVSAADLNGDGILDLVIVYSGDRLSISLGNGDGTFQPGFSPAAGNTPSGGVGIADFDGNGRIDLAVSNPDDNTISVLLQGPTTSTNLASSAAPVFVAQTVTFTATVSSPLGGTATGNVSFNLGSNALGTATLKGGVATLATTFATTGTKRIQAFYFGDGNFMASQSQLLQVVVVKAPTVTAITSSQNPSGLGQSVTFTATASSPLGAPFDGEAITFRDGTTLLGMGTLSGGIATFSTSSLGNGQHNVRAVYTGDGNLKPSSSTDLKQKIFDSSLKENPSR